MKTVYASVLALSLFSAPTAYANNQTGGSGSSANAGLTGGATGGAAASTAKSKAAADAKAAAASRSSVSGVRGGAGGGGGAGGAGGLGGAGGVSSVSVNNINGGGSGGGNGGGRAPDVFLPTIGGGGMDCPTVGFGAGGSGLGGGGGFGPSWISSDCNKRKIGEFMQHGPFTPEEVRAYAIKNLEGVKEAVDNPAAARPTPQFPAWCWTHDHVWLSNLDECAGGPPYEESKPTSSTVTPFWAKQTRR